MGVNMAVCNDGGIQLASDKQNNMMTETEINPEKKRFPFREIGWMTLTGVGGNVLVFLFLITFLHFLVAFKYIPWIIAFNTAVSGYALVDKTAGCDGGCRDRLGNLRIADAAVVLFYGRKFPGNPRCCTFSCHRCNRQRARRTAGY